MTPTIDNVLCDGTYKFNGEYTECRKCLFRAPWAMNDHHKHFRVTAGDTERLASSKCPICGVDTPHAHDTKDIQYWANCQLSPYGYQCRVFPSDDAENHWREETRRLLDEIGKEQSQFARAFGYPHPAVSALKDLLLIREQEAGDTKRLAAADKVLRALYELCRAHQPVEPEFLKLLEGYIHPPAPAVAEARCNERPYIGDSKTCGLNKGHSGEHSYELRAAAAAPCKHEQRVWATNLAGSFWSCQRCFARLPDDEPPTAPDRDKALRLAFDLVTASNPSGIADIPRWYAAKLEFLRLYAEIVAAREEKR